jgi:hypothetical protein
MTPPSSGPSPSQKPKQRSPWAFLALALALSLAGAASGCTSPGGGTPDGGLSGDGELTLAWDPNAEIFLGGYTLSYGSVSLDYPVSVDVGNVTRFTVTGLPRGRRLFFAVQAYDLDKSVESPFSDELSAVVP